MTSFNMLMSIQVDGYPPDQETSVGEAIEEVLVKHGVSGAFRDRYSKKPLIRPRRLVKGGTVLKGGTERSVIVVNPSRWPLASDLQSAVSTDFGPSCRATL